MSIPYRATSHACRTTQPEVQEVLEESNHVRTRYCWTAVQDHNICKVHNCQGRVAIPQEHGRNDSCKLDSAVFVNAARIAPCPQIPMFPGSGTERPQLHDAICGVQLVDNSPPNIT